MSPVDPTRTMFVGIGTSGPCWYRCALPAMHVGAEWCGVRGDAPRLQFVTGLSPRALDVDGLADYDAVVVQQAAGAGWMHLIRRLQDEGVVVLYEIDDDVHAVAKHETHVSRRGFDKQRLREMETAMRLCDGLIVSTEFLARRYGTLNPNVWVCRNGLDLGRYELTRPPARDTITIGWAGATGHREAVIPWLRSVARVMGERPNVRFMSVGEPFAKLLMKDFGEERATALPFVEIDTYPAAMVNFDIAIAPAGRGNFFRAKSDLRWLEAGALGIPTVADPFVYGDITDGVDGLLADSPGAAYEQLLALVDDAELRARIGAAAREHVRTQRSMRILAGQWERALVEAGERVADRAVRA